MFMQKVVSVKLTVKPIEVSDVTCICCSHADRFHTVTPQHWCVRLCLTKKCPDARAQRKSHLSDRSEPHLAFDDHKMLFWPRSSFFSPTGFLFPHLCLSSHPLHLPLAPTLHPYPPGPFITSWFVCFIFPLPHLDNIQCPGRWQQCYVMLHLSLDICVLLLLCSPPLHNTQLKESRLSFTVTCSICRGGGGDGTSAWAPLGVNTPHSGLCWFNSFQLLSALFVYTGCLKQLEQGPGWGSRGIYFCVVWPIASCRVIFVSHINQRLQQDLENKYVDTYINSEAW